MADNKYKLQFTLSNGETINAGEIVAPQGPKGDKGDSADIPYSSSTPFMDGVGSVGSANTVARGDHRHPSDTSRQEKLVSGTNIKTINGQSVLGSGDITISGDIPANINTFTEVNDVLTLTASDTIHTLGAKIVALGQSVIHVKPNDTARAQVDRIMGNPSTGGPPSSYCDYWFKVLSERLIYVFFGYNGRWGIINYLYNSSQHLSDNWSMCPRWMPIDPNNIEAGVADPLTLENGLNIGILGNDNVMPSYLKLTTSGIAYMLGSSAVSNALFSGGPIGNVKTLFGNQSIYGSGNIDLYVHNLVITATANNISALKVLLRFPSSSNIKIDSLADLYTACSKFGEMEASGYVTRAGKVCSVYSALCYSGDGVHFVESSGTDVSGVAWTAMTGVTIADTVTTV